MTFLQTTQYIELVGQDFSGLFKECTGHCLDAVDKYPVTSDQQREKISEILCEEQSTEVREVPNQRM